MNAANPDPWVTLVKADIQKCQSSRFADLMRDAVTEYLSLPVSRRNALSGEFLNKAGAIRDATEWAAKRPTHADQIFEATQSFCQQYLIVNGVAEGQFNLTLRIQSLV